MTTPPINTIVTIDDTEFITVDIGIVGPPGPTGPAGPPANQFRGTAYRTTLGTIDFTGVTPGDFINSGLTGILDATTAIGTSLPTAGTFGLTRTQTGTQPTYVVATADVGASSPKRLAIKLALNGTPIDATECNASVTAQTIAKLHTMYLLNLTQGDVVSLWFANYTSSASITVERARIVAFGIP
jgi:hypothetical protein